MTDVDWFDYGVQVRPHHTDYGGVVWHGTYIAWMEEARIEYFQHRGLSFSECLRAGVDLPVVDLALRYRKPLAIGDQALVKTRLEPIRGVRLIWQYEIYNRQRDDLCATATVTLVPVDLATRKILRRLPSFLQVADTTAI